MANENPALGVGFGQYNDNYDRYDTSGGRFSLRRSVHSTPFCVLSETGYLGFFTYLGIIFSCLAAQRRARRCKLYAVESKDLKEISDYSAMLRIALFGYLLGSLTVNTLFQEVFWVIVKFIYFRG